MDSKKFIDDLAREITDFPTRPSHAAVRDILLVRFEQLGVETVVEQVMAEPELLRVAKNLLDYCESTNAPILSTIEDARAVIAAAEA